MGVRDRLNQRRRTGLAGLVLSVALLSAPTACKRKAEQVEPPPAPPDRLAPGEIPLSREKAFALSLPLGAKVTKGYGGVVHVSTSLSPEALSNFVRKHVAGGKVSSGTSTTRFEGVTVPAEPKRFLDVEVRPGRYVDNVRSEMIVRDVTPVNDPAKFKTEEERWRAAGYTKDGKPLDPKIMQ